MEHTESRRAGWGIFSPQLDADPRVKAWLDTLDTRTVARLRDDATPHFKELSVPPHLFVDRSAVEHGAEHRDDVPSYALDGEQRAALRALAVDVGEDTLPAWRFRVWKMHLEGASQLACARELGMSRSTVRAALNGQEHKDEPGAMAIVADAIGTDDELSAQAALIADPPLTPEQAQRERVLCWFAGRDNTPDTIAPLAFLLVLVALADDDGRVPVGVAAQHFPRSLVTPCLAVLRAHAMAVSDGKHITIHRTPEPHHAR